MGLMRAFSDHLSHEELLARVDLALEGAHLGIWDWDLRDNTVQFDRRWCEMLGLVHADTPMHLDTWRLRVHTDDLAGCYRDIQAHLAGTTPRYENVHRMRHTSGEWLYILDRGRISGRDPDGRPTRFTGTHLDITTTERAKQVLAEHDRQLRDLVAHLPTAVAMLDTRLCYLAASESWLSMHHLATSALLGSACDDDRGRWAEVHARALRGEVQRSDAEPWTDPAGERRWIRWDARPWRTTSGELGGLVLSREDVTAEVQRQRAVEQEREARMAALAMFAGDVAHEINTPLQVIAVEAEVIMQELARPAPRLSEVGESTRAIITTTHRAAEITHALRTLARDARHDPPATQSVRALLRDAESLCRSRFAARGVALNIAHETDDDRASGRAAELLHILLAILDRALLLAATSPSAAHVRLRVDRVDRWLELVCAASTAGSSPRDDHHPEAALPGLTVAHALVERNGGQLEYRRSETVATIVWRLPVVEV